MKKAPRSQKIRQALGVFRAIAGTVGVLCLAGIVTTIVQLIQGGRDPVIAILGCIFFLVIGTAATTVFVLTHKALTLIATVAQHRDMIRRIAELSQTNEAEKRDEEKK